MPAIPAGGTLGSAVGAYMAAGKCVPVSTIIIEMTDSQKQELMDICRDIMAKLDWTDVALLSQIILADAILSEQIVTKVSEYLQEQFKVKIEYTD